MGMPEWVIMPRGNFQTSGCTICDLLTSNTVSIEAASDPANECFFLSAQQAGAIVGVLGQRKCVDLGIVPALAAS